MIPVEQRVYRILRQMDSFRYADDNERAGYKKDLPEENLIGFYFNNEDKSNAIMITDKAIILINSEMHRIDYADIKTIDLDSADKTAVNHLIINKNFYLPVLGGKGRCRDAFEFLRFLRRVVNDINKTFVP
jgi:hypothetical protein